MPPPGPDSPAATVVFQPWGRRCPAPVGQTLLQVAQDGGVALASVCGGAGSCGTCVVRVVRGAVGDLAPEEEERLTPAEREAGLRLACRARVADGGVVVVEVVPGSRVGGQPSQTESVALPAVAADRPRAGRRPARRVGLSTE